MNLVPVNLAYDVTDFLTITMAGGRLCESRSYERQGSGRAHVYIWRDSEIWSVTSAALAL